jgi:hypothetical protein
VNADEQEIACYDKIGENYFYSGDVKNAIYFHEKYCLAEIEPAEGYFRNVLKQQFYNNARHPKSLSLTSRKPYPSKLKL